MAYTGPTRPGSNKIIVADQYFEVEWPTYNFQDQRTDNPNDRFDAYPPTCSIHSGGKCGEGGRPYEPAKGIVGVNRWRPRRMEKKTLANAQAIVRQFVVHLDGCLNAEMCFNVLQNERGLSCHFLIDNDGTIYQTLDLADCAYHAAGMNETSIGVELANRGDAKKYPTYYIDRGMEAERPIVNCNIHGERYVAFDFPEKQYQAMQALSKTLQRALPNIKLEHPKNPGTGDPIFTTLMPDDPSNVILRSSYSGYVGHYHLTNQKWDPGPWDFSRLVTKAAGRRTFPLGLKPTKEKNEIPEDLERLKAATNEYYENNELGHSGFFPVGPFDGNRLYHNGVHLHADEGTDVYACFPGKVILARNGEPNGEVGSMNFVLSQHEIKVAGQDLKFFMFYMHLAKEKPVKAKKDRLKWMQGPGWDNDPGKFIALTPAEPIQAGDVIGHVGKAGPDNEPQLHLEIFTLDWGHVQKIDKEKFWKLIDAGTDRRFATQDVLIKPIDQIKKDKELTLEELQEFFRNSDQRFDLREFAILNYSEWSNYSPWLDALKEVKYRKLKDKDIEELYDLQIAPGLWWTEEMAQRLGLPPDGKVYHFHPISFISWLNQKMGLKVETVGFTRATAADIANANGSKMMDLDDKQGTSFVNEDDLKFVAEEKKLRLEDLVDGYGD